MEVKNMQLVRRCIYMIAFVVSCLPLACGYIAESGDIHIWLARIEEVVDFFEKNQFQLFPSAELTVAHNGQYSALNSNLWLLLPAILRAIGMPAATTYRLYMLFLNLVSFISAKVLFNTVFEDKNSSLMGVLLYMTSPYHIYLCYDKADLGMVAAWSLIPLLWSEIQHLYIEKITWKRFCVITILVALVGYANGVILMIAVGISILGCFWNHKWNVILPIIAGGCLFFPGAIYWLRYILKGGMGVWNLPLGSIVKKGYSVGQFFSGWTYMPDTPGMGLGIFAAMIVLVWWCFTNGRIQTSRIGRFYIFLLMLTGFASMKTLCWDLLQRVGMPFTRLVGMIETPGIMFGFTTILLAGFGAYGVKSIQKEQNNFVRFGVPLIIATASVGNAIYLYTY